MSTNPNSILKVDAIDTDKIVIRDLPPYNIEDYDLYDDKDKMKYIKDVERVCRNSYEYRRMVKFFRESLDMNTCSFYENVSNRINDVDEFNIKIHIHHEPITLMEICSIVLAKRMDRYENLDEEMTAKEVMLLHYNLMVGLIPLAETVHELVHNQYLFIPSTDVFGYYKDFLKMYNPWVPDELRDKIDAIEEASMHYDGQDKFILERHFLYTDVNGAYKLPKFEDVKDFLNKELANRTNVVNTAPPTQVKYKAPPFKIVLHEND